MSKTNRLLQDIAGELEALNGMLEAINANLSALVAESTARNLIAAQSVEFQYREELKS